MGRDKELYHLKSVLSSSTLHPTIEGENGVGKTSLVAVAGYELHRAYMLGNESMALIPLDSPFQLLPADTAANIKRRVLFEVAHKFVEVGDELARAGLSAPDVREVRKWLTKATQATQGGGLTIAGFGGSASRGRVANTSTGFSEAGFVAMIESWLRTAFPTPQHGGFLGVIDNLELLGTLQSARELLESMRDSVLGLPGMRWVLCGSRGIVRTVVSSSRLEGRLSDPMILGPLQHSAVSEVISARVRQYHVGRDFVAPVGRASFRHLYHVLNNNLRNALKYADDFSLWLFMNENPPWNNATNDELLRIWLTTQADAHLADTTIGRAAWSVFDGLVDLGGSCSPSDHERVPNR